MKEKGIYIPAAEVPSVFARYPDGNARAKAAAELLERAREMLKTEAEQEAAISNEPPVTSEPDQT